MANDFQVIKFVAIDFDPGWIRTMLPTNYANIEYTATEKGYTFAVVFEGETGVLRTIHFKIPPKEKVWVVDQVVHIPAHCIKDEPGNTVKCRG